MNLLLQLTPLALRIVSTIFALNEFSVNEQVIVAY